jgi:hypothetical protein
MDNYMHNFNGVFPLYEYIMYNKNVVITGKICKIKSIQNPARVLLFWPIFKKKLGF